MDEIAFPQPLGRKETAAGFKMKTSVHEEKEFLIRKACISDVRGILHLINGFAEANFVLPRGPQYVFENIRDFAVAVIKEEKDGRQEEGRSEDADNPSAIVACGGLHILWEDLAEVRSLAVHPDFQRRGLGRKIVEFLEVEARGLGVNKLFAFTLAEGFFRALGFEPKGAQELPAKVWGECSKCPKYFKCDEVGMLLEL